MYPGKFPYYTGSKSYYPDKVIDASPPPNSQVMNLEIAIGINYPWMISDNSASLLLPLERVRDSTPYKSISHLPYQISFCT